MSISRRNFLELSTLSASAAMLEKLLSAETSALDVEQDSAFTPARKVLSMNQDWQFFRPADGSARNATIKDTPPDDAAWEAADLPHTVRLEPRDVSGGRNYQGICWYQKSFAAQSEWKDRIVYLKFQGAMQVADVWLNGTHLITHYCGYLPFTIDISKSIHIGEPNHLLVRLDNSDNPEVPPGKPQNELDFIYFGGLYRSVQLEVLDTLHITDPILDDTIARGGIFVSFPAVSASESTVRVQSDVANDSDQPRTCTILQELIAPDSKLAATASQDLALPARSRKRAIQTLQLHDTHLWHPENPQLYKLRTTLRHDDQVIDDQLTRIGIRSIYFDKDGGLLINGDTFFSIGANRHQDHPYVGYALPPSAHYRDALKLREAGFTSYRSHYPQDPSFMDACDELGILAIVSNPGWQFVGDDLFKKRVYQDAREMIRRDRNRPSVIIWEAALNESDNRSVAAELYRIVHEEFPGPACFAGGDPIKEPVPGFNGWDVEYSGIDHNNTIKPAWIREWGDQVDNWSDQQGKVRVSRAWGETPMLFQVATHTKTLDRIYAAKAKLGGADLWAGIDAFRGYHHQPFLGAPLDLFRLPKFDYYIFQSQRPAQKTHAPAGSGPMVFIASFATLYSPSTITVYSNCEQVRLSQNGKVIARQGPDGAYHLPHPPFTFKAGDFTANRSMLYANTAAPEWEAAQIGELLAEGLIAGKVVASHIVRSPGVPAKLELHVDTCGFDPVADGADWVRVYACVCDKRGTTYPFSDDMITFSVSGEGSLIGDATIFANPVRAEAGIATALVRMSKAAGPVTVRASSPGLAEASKDFTSRTSTERHLP
jgi:beta-galactosidase